MLFIIFLIIKMNNLLGDLSDSTAKTATLVFRSGRRSSQRVRGTVVSILIYVSFNVKKQCMVQGIHSVVSFTMAVFVVLPTMTHAMSVEEVRALQPYHLARKEARLSTERTHSSDLSELCAAATVYGKMNKTAHFTDMPYVLFSLAHRHSLPVHVPVYAHPSVRFISNSIRFIHCLDPPEKCLI